MQVNVLRNYNPDSGDVETLVEMLAYGKMLLSEFRDLEDSGVETPDWLEAKLKRIQREVINRSEDVLRKKIADAKLRVESYKTPAEKRAEAQREIKRLESLVSSAE